jgi:glycosyltransferase involved in cell wall biosynthesis
MNIVQLTPGTGAFHCGTCLRDHAVVKAMRRLGHHALMVPLYLPFVTDGDGAGADSPIFYGGVNVYLEQKSPLFRHTPRWLDKLLNAKWILRLASGLSGSTDSRLLGPMTISMLRGEEGRQAKELEKLIDWLKTQDKPDVICLSNGLLVGMARRMREAFGAPVVCLLQGEDSFLNALGKWRDEAWSTAAQRCADVDAFIPVSDYYGKLMASRLNIPASRVHMIRNGIALDDFAPADESVDPPSIGFFARMIPGKGLHLVVDAFLALKRKGGVPGLKLRVAGSRTSADEKYVKEQQDKITKAGFASDVSWAYNVTLEEKAAFLRNLTLLSVPTTYGESFGLYILESLASGTPVVQPNSGAFPELIEATGGGVIFDPPTSEALAAAMEPLLIDRDKARALGQRGREAAIRDFSIERMVGQLLALYQEAVRTAGPNAPA